MNDEQKEFQEALLRSLKEAKAGVFARKTVFEVDGDKVRRVSEELPPQESKTPR